MCLHLETGVTNICRFALIISKEQDEPPDPTIRRVGGSVNDVGNPASNTGVVPQLRVPPWSA